MKTELTYLLEILESLPDNTPITNSSLADMIRSSFQSAEDDAILIDNSFKSEN